VITQANNVNHIPKTIIFSFLSLALLSNAALAQARSDKGKAAPPTPVILVKVAQESISDDIEVLGIANANESVDITSTVTENISAIHFSDGQRVEKGDPLVEMTNREEHAQIDEIRVTMEEARKQYKRAEELVKDSTLSTAIADARKRDYETAQAKLDAMQSRLNDRLILAPFSGVLGLRNVSVGALMQPGTVITSLHDDSVMKLDFTVPSAYLGVLKEGLDIEATSDAYPNRVFSGKVEALDGQMDAVTRGIIVRAVIENKDYALKSGLMMLVRIKGKPRQAWMIPEASLIAKGSDQFVFVLDDTQEGVMVHQRKVVIGSRIKGKVEVVSGLGKGERIVTHGTMLLTDGQKVRVLGQETDAMPASNIIQSGKKS
jgi:membrane fusion protein (multidrug efflux system)